MGRHPSYNVKREGAQGRSAPHLLSFNNIIILTGYDAAAHKYRCRRCPGVDAAVQQAWCRRTQG